MKKLPILIALAMLIATQSLSAQGTKEIQVEAFAVDATQDEGGGLKLGAPMIIQTTEDNGNGVRSNMRIVAADGPMAMSFMGDNGSFMTMGIGGGDEFSMLQNPSVRKDLELVDQQMDQIREIQNMFSKKIREAVGDISKGGFDPERAKNLSTVIKGMKQQQTEQISKILLPHQQDRIKQIALQMQMQSRGTAGALGSDKVAEALGITKEQKDRLKKREAELKKELEEKIAKFKADMKDALLKELNADQRSKLNEMMGDKFKSESNDWRSMLPGRMQQRMKRSSSSSDSNSSSDSDSSSSRSFQRRSSRSSSSSGGGGR